ncbi:hypothetical protein, partial [Vreelandella neptunia]|uniref:hypothetical protein n=1 Tax=Vreelandella neptunia TaxID=115551 RepID=UPI0025B32C11
MKPTLSWKVMSRPDSRTAGRAGGDGAAADARLLLAACAPATEYVRPNMTAQQRDADEKACQDIADWQALDESFSSHPKYPPLRDTQFVD